MPAGSPSTADPAQLLSVGNLGGVAIFTDDDGRGFLALHPRLGWRRVGSATDLVREADTRITALKRRQLALIAVLAAFPLMLMALVVLVLAQPVAPPGPSLSLAAAVIGCLLTGALISVGAWVASALVGSAGRAPDAPPP